MIEEEDVEKACEWLRDSARGAAQARANRIYLEAWVKTVRARIKSKCGASSNAAAEDMALIDPLYIEALDGLKQAIELDEYNRFMREAASAKIEAWRTMQANLRAEGRAHS